MTKINEKEYDYGNYPRIEMILNNGGFKKLGDLLMAIERIRYMIYMASYLSSDCVPIVSASDTLNCKYAAIWARNISDNANPRSFNVCRFTENVQNVLNAVREDCRGIFNEKRELFIGKHPEYIPEDSDSPNVAEAACDNIYDHMINDICFWGKMCGIPYNSIKNPDVVVKMLNMLFMNTTKSVKAEYMIELHRFGNYAVLFMDRESAEKFFGCGVFYGRMHKRLCDKTWVEII